MHETHGRGAVDLRNLTALVTVADTGSVTRAAERLHLVQPSVTRQIRALETELGVPLFDRTPHGMRLTAAGERLVERARRALGELDKARAEIQPEPDRIAGIVTLGLLASTADLIAEPLVSAIARVHPGIRLRLLTAYSGHLKQWLDDGDIDLSLLYNTAPTATVHVRPLLRERLWALAPASVRLSPDKPIGFAEVGRHRLVMPATGHGLRALIDDASARSSVQLDVVAETNSMDVQKQLVLAGHGWTILPGIGATAGASGLSAAPIHSPDIWREIVLARSRMGRTPAAVETVAGELTRHMRGAVRRGRWPSAQGADPSA
jgi:LysR family nitrogen assimilation transcriptional regulator